MPNSTDQEPLHVHAEVIDEDPVDPVQKAKGVAQIAGGAAVAAVGVPMLVLPGPGVAAIAGGAVIAAKGYKNLTGKEPPVDVEGTVNNAAEKAKTFTQEKVAPAGRVAAEAVSGIKNDPEKAKQMVAEGVQSASKVAFEGAKVVGKVAGKGAEAALRASAKGVEKVGVFREEAVKAFRKNRTK